jgi:long-chain fatty acid transport protein
VSARGALLIKQDGDAKTMEIANPAPRGSANGFRLVICRAAAALAVLLPYAALGEIGPALTGLTGRANDATSVFFSPAGITRLERPELVAQATFMYQESKFDVQQASVAGGDSDRDSRLFTIPAAYYVHPLGERWRLGLSVNVPSGIGHDYGKKWSGRYLSESSDLAFVAASTVLAYRFTDQLSLGAGPYLVYTDSKTKARVNNLPTDYGDGSVRLEEDGAAFGYMLGAMYEFTPATRIGAVYRSSVKPDLEGTPSFENLNPTLRGELAALDLLGTEVDVDFTVPAQAQVGVYTELSDRWSLTGDLLWINMSEFGISRVSVAQDQISVRNDDFRDMWIGSAGVKYRYADERAVSFGALYATSPTRDSRRSIALPFDRVISVGAGIERPCFGFVCNANLSYVDLGDGDLSEDGGPLLGSVEGSFSSNWAVALDFQLRWRF